MNGHWDKVTSPSTQDLLGFLASWEPPPDLIENQYRNLLYPLLGEFVQQRIESGAISFANPDPCTTTDQLAQEPVQNEPHVDGYAFFSEAAADAYPLKPDLSVGRRGIELKKAPMNAGALQRALGQAWLYMRARELDTLVLAVIGSPLHQYQADALAALLAESEDHGTEWHLVHWDGSQWLGLASGGPSFDAGGEFNTPPDF